MTPRKAGPLFMVFAVAAVVFRALQLHVPVFKIPFLAGAATGYVLSGLALVAGAWITFKLGAAWSFNPQTLKKLLRFRAIRRGYVSFLTLLALVGLASLDNLLVGKQALVVHYQGVWSFPFVHDPIPGKDFGLGYDGETDYRVLQKKFREENKGDWLLMPPVPFAATLDSPPVIETLEQRDGKVYPAGENEPYSGVAYTVFKDKPSQKRQEFTFRHGVREGDMRGWNDKNEQVEKGRYQDGQRTDYKDYTSKQDAAQWESKAGPELRRLVYPPSPPSRIHQHYLGTNSTGIDVLAMLFGGLQQALLAAVLYLTAIFVLGIFVGGTLGFFGGVTDLTGQRVIEIWSALPFLLVVMIISSILSPNTVILVGILAAFGWMNTAIFLRTATYKEKARDYVSAATLLGASTPRVIFHHVLPNVIAILVTLAPFEVVGVITALAGLDYLGYGVPPDVPSWGRLLEEGVSNFTYPWIVSSAFSAMALVLVLVTFVGEAVREAFDPKKFTTYE